MCPTYHLVGAPNTSHTLTMPDVAFDLRSTSLFYIQRIVDFIKPCKALVQDLIKAVLSEYFRAIAALSFLRDW